MSGSVDLGRVAVVGIGCRFPGGANSAEQFWRLLCDGTDAITEIPRERFDLGELYDPDPSRPGKLYTRWGGFVDGIDAFDAEFFGISPREAARVDPQQRLLLEVAWEALEDAGVPADRLAGSRTGVFIGLSTHDYFDMQVTAAHRHLLDAHSGTGTALSIAANRISYAFDLRGPSLVVDTACSSSLTAVHLACENLRLGKCDLAIAGGVNVFLNPETAIGYCKASMLSPDGRCKAFDIRANGFVRGEGAGVVVLKRLGTAIAEGDRIYAVVCGSAINQDGRTVGITVPSADAQEALIREALRDGGVEACAVQYIEAHGTGTRVGDPIEATAIGRALANGHDPSQPCLIGSVKTNIGHLEAAAGIAGFIKTALSLQRHTIPPSLHFTQANPAIPLDDLGLRVATTLQPWPANGRRALAGVNAFGFGGANAHVLLEEPPRVRTPEVLRHASAHILPLSARHPEALRQLASHHRDSLATNEGSSVADVCYSAAVRRSHHVYRIGLVADSRDEMVEQIDDFLSRGHADTPVAAAGARGGPPKLAFVFTGMGPQWWGMGRQLLEEEPVFRQAIEECDRRFRNIATWPLLDALTADESVSRVHEADQAVAANLAIQMGLVALLESWGIRPDAIVGHSAGEMAAACAAGALSLEDALLVAFHRGRLQYRASGSGTMLSASLSEEAAQRIVEPVADLVSIAAVNSPTSVTLSGDRRALEQIAAELTQQKCFNRFVRVEVAYHGPPMDALRDELLDSLASLAPRPPSVALVSTVSGTWAEAPLDPHYWFGNLRRPVRFADAVGRLIDDDYDVFLEIGPHPALSASVAECLSARGKAGSVLPTLRRKEQERRAMLRSIAALYARGRSVNWTGVYPNGNLVPLPHYPWQRERHWFESSGAVSHLPTGIDSGHPLLGYRLRSVRPSWESDLGQSTLDYLDDHRVQGRPVFPAAAYVETALAVADRTAPGTTTVIEDLTFKKVLFLPHRKDTLLQAVLDPHSSTFEVHSGTAEGDAGWTLHATGKLKTTPGESSGRTVKLAHIRDRCTMAVPVAEAYESLASRGLGYRGAFRGIDALWGGNGEGLARIALPSDAQADAGAYRVHPALLDSAFQALLAAVQSGDTAAPQGRGLYLPVSIKRVTFVREPGMCFWAHARLVCLDADALEGDVTIFDDEGQVAMVVESLRCRGLEDGARARSSPADEPTYQLVWEPQPLGEPVIHDATGIRTSEEVGGRLQQVASRLADERGWAEHLRHAEPAFDTIAAHFVRAALIALGWNPRDGLPVDVRPLGDALGVVPRHRRFFARLLEILRDSPELEVSDGTSAVERARAIALCERACTDQPANRPAVDLLQRCGEQLDRILRGQVDAREVLFAPAALPAWARFFVDLPWYAYYNTLVAEAVGAAIDNAPAAARLRVLEVGAGTAGTTQSVLPRLHGRNAEYYFTDLSTLFLAQARDRFRNQPLVRVASLDIEADPIAQLGSGSFDLILAANVVHATADLRTSLRHIRRLLAPGGLLVLLEVTRKMALLDLIFGITEGWWRFTDTDVRPSYPMMSAGGWRALLEEAGFEGPQSVSGPCLDGEPLQAVILATAPAVAGDADESPSARSRDWLVFADATGLGDRLTFELRSRGDRVVTVRAGDGFLQRHADSYEASASSVDDATHLIDNLADSGFRFDGLLHSWSLDAPGADLLTATTAVEAQRVSCGSVVSLLQGFERSGRTLPPLWLITRGAQAVTVGERPHVAQAPIWGIGRVLTSEQPDVRCRLVDLGPQADDQEIRALLREIDADDIEEEVALRGSARYATRFRRARVRGSVQESQKQARAPSGHAFRLDVDTPGALETLTLRETLGARPGPGEIAIQVHASGINFRDVMLALGMLPPMALPGGGGATVLGFECAGIVVECGEGVEDFEPGDEVMAVALGAFASRVVTRAEMAAPKPGHLTFEEAATVPLAFVTAHYGLNHLARLSRGERVLIHAATGGVGLAAVQIAKRAGAEIFATAGNPEKRAYLKAMGIDHVMDSRSVAFADEVLAATGGEGVDVVLNSLAGEAIPKGLSILRPYGRFIEMGKRDIYADAPIGLLPFDRNLSFSSIALERMCVDRPGFVGSMLGEIAGLINAHALEPLPHTIFDLAEAEDALRFLAQAKHIGKIVLAIRQPSYRVAPCAERAVCHPDATYIISGGLGGLGLAVARRLVELGARHLVLMSRSGTPIPENQAAFDALRVLPVEVATFAGDVSREADLRRILQSVRETMPALRGIVHAAMVLDDVLLQHLTPERLETVLAPKVGGAWNLHRLTVDDELDFFVMFSSGMSQLGTKWQGNYAAANVFLDMLAPYRRSLGLPALTLNWGAIGEVGYVSRHREIAQHLQRQGMEALTPGEALGWMEEAIRLGVSNLTVARMDWRRWSSVDPNAVIVKKTRRLADLAEAGQATARDGAAESGALLPVLAATPHGERQALLMGHVVERVARVLGTSAKKVDADRPLTELGIDSLMAVELQTVVDRDLRVSLPLATLLEGVTVRQLSVRLLEQLALESVAPEPVAASHRPASPAARDVDEVPIATRAEDLEATATVPLVSEAPVVAPPCESAPLAPVPTVTVATPATGEADYATVDCNRWTRRQRLGQKVISGLFRVFAPIDVQGLENIPPSGPVLVAVNHLSMLDVALILTILPRRCICIAADSLRRYPWLRWFLDIGDSIYVRRGEADLGALAQGLAVLRAGGLLGVAPEGTRSRTGGLTRGQPGAAYMAAEAPAPILPVVAYGQEQVLRNLGRLRRTRVHVRVGSLITVSPGERTAARLQRDTDRVMTALAEMLPPAYRGVYGDLVGGPQSPGADASAAR